jgi:hypothetical protein
MTPATSPETLRRNGDHSLAAPRKTVFIAKETPKTETPDTDESAGMVCETIG